MYDGFKLIAEFDVLNSDEVLRQYAWSRTDLDTPMWMKSGGNYYYYQLDGNKNVVGLVDEAGALANNYEYSPFGKLINEVESVEQPFKFSSEYADDEAGLIYYNYRYYNPENGKWLKRDPIAEKGGLNLYGFISNNSISYTDSLGLSEFMKWQYEQIYGTPYKATDPSIPNNISLFNLIQIKYLLVRDLTDQESKRVNKHVNSIIQESKLYVREIDQFLQKYPSPQPTSMTHSEFKIALSQYMLTKRIVNFFVLDEKVFNACLMKKSLLTVKNKLKLISERSAMVKFQLSRINVPFLDVNAFSAPRWIGGGVITIFPLGWNQIEDSFRQLLAHELSHAVAGTKDYYGLETKELDERLNDAYNYEKLF